MAPRAGARRPGVAGVRLAAQRRAGSGVPRAALCAALGLLCGYGAGCGATGSGGHDATRAAAGAAAIAISGPADGDSLRARSARDRTLRRRARISGMARPGSVVFLHASCRPAPCEARATAAAGGRWSVAMTLTTSRVARFVTVDASAGARQPPVAVTTLELVAAPRARTAGGVSPARSRAAAPPPPPPRSLPHDVLVIGDSLAVGMEDALRAALPGWRVTFDARTGRPLAEGMRILAAQHDAPAIVAFSLFTNDEPGSTAALEQAVRASAARPGGCAVWATIVRPPVDGVSYAAANELLKRLAGDPQVGIGLQLVDWSAVIARTPAYLAPDGVHSTPAGYRARGQLYASAIRACAGDA
ncbi:MAG TPA: hypothetical protein VGF63_13380 [Solirubrobacteraceae bacterium]|jgi:hypothetical protein